MPWLLAAVLGLVVESPAQEAASGGRYDVSGNSLRRRVTVQDTVTYVVGNARLWRDDIEVTADLGRYYEARRLFWAVGNVHALTDSIELWADSVRVVEATDMGYAYGRVKLRSEDGTLGTGQRGILARTDNWMALAGNARLIDADVTLEGDSLYFDQTEDFVEAFGNVQVIDRVNETVVTGAHGILHRDSGLAWVDSMPRLTHRRQGGKTATVESRWMSFSREGERSRAIGDVSFRQDQSVAHADTADFLGEDLLILRGSPQVVQGSQLMSGQEIRFHYEDGDLRRIDVVGDASVVDSSPDTLATEFSNIPLANTLTGDSLKIHVRDSEVQRTEIRGNAVSIYIPEDQGSAVSVNHVRGDQIDIRFVGGRVNLVEVRGSAVGDYRFLERETLRQDAAALADSLLSSAVQNPDSLAAEFEIESVISALDTLLSTPPDSLLNAAGPEDSAAAVVDFDANAQRVDYSGDGAAFYLENGRIHISGTAEVKHGTLTLASEDVYFDTTERELLAEGDPLLIDSGSELVGDRMGYLFENKTGAVSGGGTRYEDGFYYGEHVRRMQDEALLVRGGRYTTCDLAAPHYHFRAKRMKLKVGERVVARQVTFVVSDLPVFMLPFYFKSLDSGRHSGIIFPNVNIGVSSRQGRYVRDLGYYWATNDYTDFSFKMAYNERKDLSLRLANRYNVRYGMSGNSDFTRTENFSENKKGSEWIFNANHRQPDLLDVWNATASLRLSSSNITSFNPITGATRELLPSQLRSNASLSRGFASGARLNLSGSRTQYVNAEDDDLTTDELLYTQTLPQFSLSFKTRPLLPGGRGRRDGNPMANTLRDIQLSQSYRGQLARSRREISEEDDLSLSGNWGLSYAPQARLGPFSVTSSASFAETYTRESRVAERYAAVTDSIYDAVADTFQIIERTLRTEDVDEVETDTRPSLSFSNSLRTDLYGIFATKLGPVTGIKHKMSYSMSHSWRPQLGDKQESSQNFSFQLGNELSLKYHTRAGRGGGRTGAAREGGGERSRSGETIEGEREGSLSPGDASSADGSATEADSVSITHADSLGAPTSADAMQAAADAEEESDFQEKKLDRLVTWNLSTSYNPDAEPRRQWADITSAIDLNPGFTRAIDFGLSQRIDPYQLDVLSTSITTRLRLSGELDLGGGLFAREEKRNSVVDRIKAPTDSTDARAQRERDEWNTYDEGTEWHGSNQLQSSDQNRLPWNFSTRASITNSQGTATRATISLNADAALPGKWKIAYRSNFDIESGEFTNQYYSLSRDLHCWRLEFNRSVADGQDFNFRLYLLQIPQVEITRGDKGVSGYLDRLGQ